jgi:hypothetical protein
MHLHFRGAVHARGENPALALGSCLKLRRSAKKTGGGLMKAAAGLVLSPMG